MKILIIPDSFKGSLKAIEVCTHIKNGLIQSNSDLDISMLPFSDGGEGLIDCILYNQKGSKVSIPTFDPLGRKINAAYGQLKDNTAIVEIAEASGLTLLKPEERNPLVTSTYGTGLIIKAAIENGNRKIILGLGGSATNDGGAGILQALGVQLLDKYDKPINHGNVGLSTIHSLKTDLVPREVYETTFIIASDVENPLTGPQGASFIYGPQKGAQDSELAILEYSILSFAKVLQQQCKPNILTLKGGGAAGGAAIGLLSLFDASIKPGFNLISRMLGLESIIEDTDLIITGEGKLDTQSLQGKVTVSVAKLASFHSKELMGIVGIIEGDPKEYEKLGFTKLVSIQELAANTEDSMKHAGKYLEQLSKKILD